MSKQAAAPGMRFPLYAVATAIALTFALAINGRLEKRDMPTSQQDAAAVVAVRDLRFEDLPNGDIGVFDADSGAIIEMITPGTNNFMRGILRALVRERRKARLGQTIPFHLSSHSDGHLLLADPATGAVLDLGSFGSDNIGVFARLLPVAGALPTPVAQTATARAS